MIQQEMSYFLELIGELSDQPAAVAEKLAGHEILTSRRLYAEADRLFERLPSEKDPAGLMAYLSKLFAAMAHQEALLLLLDNLGVTPDTTNHTLN